MSDPRLPGRARRSRQLVLDAVRREGAATRTQVQMLTGLSRSAVAEATQALLAAGRLTERRPPARAVARGRPPAVLVPREPAGSVAALDLGHSHVAVAVADTTGRLLAERRAALEVDHAPAAALDTVEALLDECLAEAGVARADLAGAAAGLPGPIGAGSGTIRSPTILAGWSEVNPAAEFTDRVGLPVVVHNDADMGARGELRFGAGRGLRDFIYVKASHGIGAGLVLGGRGYRGTAGLAGEIGHTPVGGATGWCRCGRRGCLESVATVDAVRRRLLPRGHGDSEDLTPLTDLARRPAARRHLADVGAALGQVLAGLCNCLNPEAVLIGGEVGELGGPVITGVREAIDRLTLPAHAHAVRVVRAQLGGRAELLGAVWTAIEQAKHVT